MNIIDLAFRLQKDEYDRTFIFNRIWVQFQSISTIPPGRVHSGPFHFLFSL